ncbi:formyltetrahydrofolate deformylase [Pseudemcibacter aquimaris]|uniref:formyltetrahydrofolate deformylase n=1 Tax=Pseudemcibacter aquimaris TaxID=2857064 RepID=UPI002013B78C|nr:formyltetrahydrofolate deformylase [Pseudemcibacter aquimaris]MCC3861511.1 formyltetrahydrofolate deformylase [Pseudemcibacter aquimaris]WDU58280.1 formyltetrahydrofolate deformylase [Pseudemcibacter aquimaris]
MKKNDTTTVLTVCCPDKIGLVAALSGFLTSNGAFIREANHYFEEKSGKAFLRFSFTEESAPLGVKVWQECSKAIAKQYEAEMRFYDMTKPMRVVIAVSKFGHCLHDLIHRWKANVLPIEICAVISNHEEMRSFVEWSGIPYHHLPITKKTKKDQENQIRELFASYDAELLVLARYMQILSEDMCRDFSGKAINIHHSFLPSFKGARPYSQAHDKGVKIIGATAHYVTTDLDEGPIIEQAVERVDHATSVDAFVNIGRDTESVALMRAVRWHAERRVMLSGRRTVVFK